MRPVAGIGRQHQADDIDRAGRCRRCSLPSKKPSCAMAKTSKAKARRRRRDHQCRRRRPRRRKMLRMAARGSASSVDRQRRRHQWRSSRPIRRWRSTLGQRVDHRHGDHDQHQDRRDVGIVELADRLDQVLADAAGADEAHDRGAAHVDLEAQQRVAREVRQRLRQRAEAHRRPASARRSAVTPSTGFMSMFSTTSANSLPSAPMVWMAMASTPAIGPSPKAITNISAKTSSGTVRQNSQKRRTSMRSQRLRRQVGGRQEAQAEARRARPAPCRHRRSAGSRRAAAASARRPQNHSAEIGPDRAAALEMGQAADVAR